MLHFPRITPPPFFFLFICFLFILLVLRQSHENDKRGIVSFSVKAWGTFWNKKAIFGLSSLIQFWIASIDLSDTFRIRTDHTFRALSTSHTRFPSRSLWRRGFGVVYSLAGTIFYQFNCTYVLYALFFTHNGLTLMLSYVTFKLLLSIYPFRHFLDILGRVYFLTYFQCQQIFLCKPLEHLSIDCVG